MLSRNATWLYIPVRERRGCTSDTPPWFSLVVVSESLEEFVNLDALIRVTEGVCVAGSFEISIGLKVGLGLGEKIDW